MCHALRFIRTVQEKEVVIRIGDKQKEKQLKDIFGRVYAYYTGHTAYYVMYHCRLHIELQYYKWV